MTAEAGTDGLTQQPDKCVVCDKEIHTMAFKGTKVCSERCRKAGEGDARTGVRW